MTVIHGISIGRITGQVFIDEKISAFGTGSVACIRKHHDLRRSLDLRILRRHQIGAGNSPERMICGPQIQIVVSVVTCLIIFFDIAPQTACGPGINISECTFRSRTDKQSAFAHQIIL